MTKKRLKKNNMTLVLSGLFLIVSVSLSLSALGDLMAQGPEAKAIKQVKALDRILELTDKDSDRLPDEFLIGYDDAFLTLDYLKRVKSPLAEVSVNGVPVYKIIYRLAERFNVNQRYILMVLQREQSLVLQKFNDKELKHRLDRACGYGVSEIADVDISRYLGFERQVRGCCRVSKRLYRKDKAGLPDYLILDEKRPKYRWGKIPTDEEFVQILARVAHPRTAVSAMLYEYTPKHDATKGALRIWRRLFKP